MKQKFISGLCLCLFCTFSFSNLSAQEYKNFDLNRYYTPDIVRNGLDLNFNTNGGLSNQLYQRSNSLPSNDTVNSNDLYGQLYSSYFRFTNTRKNESLLLLNLGFNGQFRNYTIKPINRYFPNEYSSNSNQNVGLTYSNKSYNASKQFLSFGVTTRLNLTGGTEKSIYFDSPEKTTKTNSNNSTIAPYVGIGLGRIESVTDARQAIYILDDLAKRGVLTRQLSNDEIFRFSQQISKVKNKRFLDARLHKIEEISAVDSFFVNNNLLTTSDAVYFTTLYDNWENGANFVRNSGQVFEIQLTPFSDWNNNKTQTDILNGSSSWKKQNYNQYGGRLEINYSYAKQINLNWEKSADVSLVSSLSRDINARTTDINSHSTEGEDYKNEQNIAGVNLNGSYGVAFYPNTRTYLSVILSQRFVQNYYNEINNNQKHNLFNSNTNLSFAVVYYVSPQLSFSGNASIYNNYDKNYYSESSSYEYNNLRVGFSASLKYSFF